MAYAAFVLDDYHAILPQQILHPPPAQPHLQECRPVNRPKLLSFQEQTQGRPCLLSALAGIACSKLWERVTVRRRLYSMTPHHDVHEVEPFDLLPTTPALLAAAEDEFQQLCFNYGIELDDVVSHRNLSASAAGSPAAQPALTATMPAGHRGGAVPQGSGGQGDGHCTLDSRLTGLPSLP